MFFLYDMLCIYNYDKLCIYTRHNLWILIVASIIRSYNSVIWNLYVKFTYRPGFNPPHGFPQVLKKHWTIHGLIKVRLLEKLCPCFEPSDGVASRWFQGQSWNFCCEDFFWFRVNRGYLQTMDPRAEPSCRHGVCAVSPFPLCNWGLAWLQGQMCWNKSLMRLSQRHQ